MQGILLQNTLKVHNLLEKLPLPFCSPFFHPSYAVHFHMEGWLGFPQTFLATRHVEAMYSGFIFCGLSTRTLLNLKYAHALGQGRVSIAWNNEHIIFSNY